MTTQIVDNNSPLGWAWFRTLFRIRTTLIHSSFLLLSFSLFFSSSHIKIHTNSNLDHFKFLGSFLRIQSGNAGWPQELFLHNVPKRFGKFWCTFPKFLLTPKGACLGFNKYLNFCAKKNHLKSAVQHFNNFSFSLPSMEEFQVHDIQF